VINLQVHGDRRQQFALLRAIYRLQSQNGNDYDTFREALDLEVNEINQYLRLGEGPELHRAQGRAQALDELCVFLDKTPENYHVFMGQIEKAGNT